MRAVSIILITLIVLLFCFDYLIIDMYYDSNYVDPVTGKSPWWNLRFKYDSTTRVLLALVILLNAEKIIKIISIPLLAFMLGDWKDRVIFNSPDFHWSDWILITASIFWMIKLLRNAKPRRRDLEGYT